VRIRRPNDIGHQMLVPCHSQYMVNKKQFDTHMDDISAMEAKTMPIPMAVQR
jgi:hypothetical protein